MTGIEIDFEQGDVALKEGRISTVETTEQTAVAVLMSWRGEWKEHPLLGGEARGLAGGPGDPLWGGRARSMLRACGVDCEKVTVKDGVIAIE